MTLSVALSQPLAVPRGAASLRRQPRAIKVLAASGKPEEPAKPTGLGPKLAGLLHRFAPAEPAPTPEQQAQARAEEAKHAFQEKTMSAANAVKRGANKLKGGIEDAGDAIKEAADDALDGAPNVKDSAKFIKEQAKQILTKSPPQQKGGDIMAKNHPFRDR